MIVKHDHPFPGSEHGWTIVETPSDCGHNARAIITATQEAVMKHIQCCTLLRSTSLMAQNKETSFLERPVPG